MVITVSIWFVCGIDHLSSPPERDSAHYTSVSAKFREVAGVDLVLLQSLEKTSFKETVLPYEICHACFQLLAKSLDKHSETRLRCFTPLESICSVQESWKIVSSNRTLITVESIPTRAITKKFLLTKIRSFHEHVQW